MRCHKRWPKRSSALLSGVGWRRRMLRCFNTLNMASSEHTSGHSKLSRSYPPFLLIGIEVCGFHSCGG